MSIVKYGIVVDYSISVNELTIYISVSNVGEYFLLQHSIQIGTEEYLKFCNDLYLFGQDNKVHFEFLKYTWVQIIFNQIEELRTINSVKLDEIQYGKENL